MDDVYLIEIRLARTKWRIKKTIFFLADYFGISDYMEKHPHVTIFGPFALNSGISVTRLLDKIGQIAFRYETIPFTIGGWEKREGLHGGVIAFAVTPSIALWELTKEISETMLPITQSHNHWDSYPEKKWFHVTVANRLDKKRASAIYSELTTQPAGDLNNPGFPQGFFWRFAAFFQKTVFRTSRPFTRPVLLDDTGLRITIMCGQEIFAEYDLLKKTWIDIDELHDPKSWQRTLAAYRRQAGFELTFPPVPDPEDIFLISDLHLGHSNIIRYCSRPFLFSDVAEMDRVLIQNWNHAISPQNKVYYLGDLRYGKNAPAARNYKDHLNGIITFINGNHDDPVPGVVPSAVLEYNGLRFLLIHDPADAPRDFDGWVIHGHHHNNDLRTYPFMNISQKRINVSAETIGYIPVSLRELYTLIQGRISSGNPEPVLLRYAYVH
jgi:calcineurin-like phosphoesterase family protein